MYQWKYILPFLASVVVIVNVVYYCKIVDLKVHAKIEHRLAGRKVILRMNSFQHQKPSVLIDDGDYRCIAMYGGSDPTKADLAVFLELDINHYNIPPVKRPQDIWAFLGKEPQIIITPRDGQNKWDGMFNYSATFSRNNEGRSHIWLPELVRKSPPTTHYFRPKPKMRPLRALWFVSHCTVPGNKRRIYSAREEYVLELSKYITIDIYSSPKKRHCFDRFGSLTQSSKRPSGEEVKFEDYMFVLAFENNLCQDYITARLWEFLESSSTMIPIALGGLSIENYEYVAPPNSFIHVRNFTSPEALANHLKFVSQDDNAFHYYNQWRNEYWLKTKHLHNADRIQSGFQDYNEYFCKLIHERPHKVWYNFSKDHSPDQCIDVSMPEAYCPYYNMSCNKQT